MAIQQYLICSDDYLKTAFFCGNARECSQVLGITEGSFYSQVCKGMRINHFFRIEKVMVEDDE